ncbi:hypothetical protein [Nocardia sp. NBC_01388]|uniref:hypothetical protein n=1 Tax=Nocardia sp. NBC_01388 TaxID=2903596 RepID=UPI00325099F7
MRVLKAVHVHAATVRVMQDRAKAKQRSSGQAPPASWYEDLHGRAALWQELENAAAAGGVPAAWVTQTRERATLGMAWRADLHWRDTEFVNRGQLLNDLQQKVRHVQDMAAVAAVYGERGAQSEVGTAQMFDRKLRILTQRINAVAAVLEVSAPEAERLWGERSWSAAAESVRDHSRLTLDGRWRAHARTNTTDLALQAMVLNDAGIAAGTHALPDLGAMAQLIRTHLSVTVPPGPGTAVVEPGAQITEAIDAAGITSATSTEFASTDISEHPLFTPPVPGIEP